MYIAFQYKHSNISSLSYLFQLQNPCSPLLSQNPIVQLGPEIRPPAKQWLSKTEAALSRYTLACKISYRFLQASVYLVPDRLLRPVI
jgi:hypothetical protein